MDLATLIGVIGGLVVIVAAIMLGGDLGSFFNVPGLAVVVGGTACATLVKFTLADFMKVMKRGVGLAFKNTQDDPRYIFDQAIEMATTVRKNGLLGLENVSVDNELFQRGISMCLDGHSVEIIRDSITREVEMAIQTDELGENMFRGIGDAAPAWGMIGTLIGLVQMLGNLDDPASIGPAMAIAMLTTFYGAVIANLMALPMADKMGIKAEKTTNTKQLIIESVCQIHASQNPNVLKELLGVYLPGGAPKEEE
ncbi:MAG: MotA/TolQ/ExbB proton channel family protein [Rhodospirillales bacterium]|nr:MotA/TolQ/ExbB proton channel family protein [Rhodospirillales bacterium]